MNYYIKNNKIYITEANLGCEMGFYQMTVEQALFYETNRDASITEIINCKLDVEIKNTISKEELEFEIYTKYEKAETNNLTPAGAIQLAEWCQMGLSKALAVRQWIVDLYNERDDKLTKIENGEYDVDLNPSQPEKPYSFREMKMEFLEITNNI